MLNFRWIDNILRKLSSGQGRPSKNHIFGHVTSLIGENVIAGYSENFPGLLNTPAKYEKIRLMAAKLLQKENADPAESFLPNKASLAGRLITD